MEFYDFDEVRKSAAGHWLPILESIAPELAPAIEKLGRHVPCPVMGGTDGFRLFKDAHDTGGGISNQHGPFPDGFALLMWLRRWTFVECAIEVAKTLGIKPESRVNSSARLSEQQRAYAKNFESAKTYSGVLDNFGAARYEGKSENERSYFATLIFQSGTVRTFWGVDLERAIAESKATLGEVVTLANMGRVPVTLTVDRKDASGAVVGQSQIESFRNTWTVIRSKLTQAPVQAEESVVSIEKSISKVSGSDIVHPAQFTNREVISEAVTQSSKVVPLSIGKPKQWLIEAQERAKANLERERQKKGKAAEKVLQVWEESVLFPSVDAEPMRRYFKNRSILFRMTGAENQDSMRFHPNLAYYESDGKLKGYYPAIVCAIRDLEGTLITLHRTYITPAGKKAPFDNVRKMMTVPEGMTITGAAIQLGKPQGVLGVGEGLETALSAYRVTQVPTWSTVSARLMETLEVPESVHTVLIWTDKDKSVTGEKSANVLRSRLTQQGKKVHILMPPVPRSANAKSVDWNDVLCTQGVFGFPSIRHLI